MNLSKSLAQEFGPKGIHVNCVSPGPVATDLWLGEHGVAETVAAATGVDADTARASRSSRASAASPTGRFTTPEEVATLVVLLASERTANVTGANYVIDGGLIKTTWTETTCAHLDRRRSPRSPARRTRPHRPRTPRRAEADDRARPRRVGRRARAGAASIDRLQDARLSRVDVPANPLRSVAADAAYLRSFLGTISGPIVLVGHSYGGAVITNAATGNQNVKALVYVAAFAPDQGDSVGSLGALGTGGMLGPGARHGADFPAADGSAGADAYIKPARSARSSPPTCRARTAAVSPRRSARCRLRRWRASGAPAWKTISVADLVAGRDNAIGADTSARWRAASTRAGPSRSRAPPKRRRLISRPARRTADLILEALRSVPG